MLIGGKYEMIKKLGSGFSGEVLLAKDASGLYALKFLKNTPGSFSKEESIANFKNEFSLLKELSHPHVARIEDFGYQADQDQYFFTTEFIDGSNLFQASQGQSAEAVENLFVQALRALEYLHSHAIYHFDLKPENILVGKDAQGEAVVKIIDFGLAGYKPKGKMAGTPSYMAPEIILGSKPDGRADLYSIGVVFYECLTGGNPFRSDQLSETLNRQQTLRPEPPSKKREGLPKYLDSIVAKLTAKNPSERYAGAAAVIRELNQLSGKNYAVETTDTLLSYLPGEGQLVGRQTESDTFKRLLSEFHAKKSDANWKSLLLLSGPQGVGKSRLLKEMRFFAQLSNAPVYSWKKGVSPEIEGPQVIVADDLNGEEFKRLESFYVSHPSSLLVAGALTDENAAGGPAPAGAQTPPLTLAPFTQGELKEYVASMTGLSSPPPKLLQELFQRTHGNPLFVSEFLKEMIRRGLLFDEQGRWKAATYEDLGIDFAKIDVPDTIEAFLLGQVNSKEEKERKVLNLLALLGRPASLEELSKLSGWKGAPEAVARFAQEGTLERDETRQSYDFKNPLLRKALGENLNQEEKTALHKKIAQALQEPADKADEHLYHLGFSGQGKASASALSKLGEKALQEGRARDAVSLLKKAGEMAAELSADQQMNLALKLGDALLKEGNLNEAGQVFDQARSKLKEVKTSKDNVLWKVDVSEKLGAVYLKRHDPSMAKEIFTGALTLLEEFPVSKSKRLAIQNFMGRSRIVEGKLDQALEIFKETDRVWREELTPAEQKEVLNNDLATVYHLKQDEPKALEQFQKDLEFYQSIHHHFLTARTHYHLGEVHQALKEIPKAVEHYKTCVEISKAHRHFEMLFRAYNGLGNLYQAEKDSENALHYYGRALTIAQKIQDVNSQAAISVNMAILHNESGDFEKAHPYLVNAVFLLERIPERTSFQNYFLARAKMESGDVNRKLKKFEAARDDLRDALKMVEANVQMKSQLYWVHATLSRLYFDQGRLDEAKESFEEAKRSAQDDSHREDLKELQERAQGAPSTPKAEPKRAAPEAPESREESGGGFATLEKEYETILTLNKYLNSEHNLEFLLKTVLHYALELSGAERGLILLVSEKGALELKASLNTEVNLSLSEISQSIAEKVLNSGEAVETDDASGDTRFNEVQSVMILKLRSILCLPVNSRSQTVGVLYLDNRYRPGVFKKANFKVLQAFCDQVGIAIENAKLIQRYQEVEAELRKKLNDAEDEVSTYQALFQEEAIALPTKYSYDKIIAKSKAMYEIFRLLDKITETALAVFIHGETGTGKELIAKALHYNHKVRKDKRFVAINCGAIPANLMESELFGHKAGSFTGAIKDKKGLFLEADGGTLFLDEIAELDMNLQVKLLRVLEESEFTPVGDTKTMTSDVRVVAASHKNLEEEIKAGRFREDLFYRICQIKIELPPLRVRKEDIPLLSEKFIEIYRQEHKIENKLKIAPSFMKKMMEYDWPGNVRELENVISVATALAENDELTYESLPTSYGVRKNLQNKPAEAAAAGPEGGSGMKVLIDGSNVYDASKSWQDYEKLITAKAYQAQKGHPAKTAEILDLSVATLYKRIKEFDLANANNPLYRDAFVYDPKLKLHDYVKKVFQAAHDYSGSHPYTAIKWLGVSQGYFYKILKELKEGR